jgi:hypothetical protein
MTSILDVLPLWGHFLLTLALVGASIEGGYRLGLYRRLREQDEKEAPVGAIVAATLGLLGLILAFTFGLAASRFDARRKVVVDEANAIGTAYLRAGLLAEGRSEACRRLLREYLDVRLKVIGTRDFETALRRSRELHREIWKEAEAAGKSHPGSIATGLFIQSVNNTIDIHEERVLVSIHGRLPDILWVILYIASTVTMAGVGYYEGLTKSKRSLIVLVLIVTYAAILALIADHDKPQSGFLRVSQEAMINLRKTMTEMP